MLRIRTRRRILAVPLLLLAAPGAAEKLQLHVTSTPGDTLIYSIKSEQEINFQGAIISITEAGTVQLVAQASRHDTLQFTARFSGFTGSVKRGDELMERKPEYDGATLRAAVSPRGEVLEVALQSSASGDLREQVQNLLDNFFVYAAPAPVGPGDTWTRARQIPNKEDASAPPKVDATTEYTLDEVTKKDGKQVAKVLGKSKGKVNIPSATGLVTGDVRGDAQILVGVEDGLVREMKYSSDFSGMMGTTKGSRTSSLEVKRTR